MKRDYLALLLALVFPSLMAALYFIVLDEGNQDSPALKLAFGAGKLVQFSFPLFYVWCFERENIQPKAPTLQGVIPALGFGLFIGAAILTLYFAWLKHSPLTADAPDMIFRKLQQFGMATPLGFVEMAVAISVIHSLLEEYYWRWFVFGWLNRSISLFWAIVISGFGFMAHHVIVLAVYFPGQVLWVGFLSASVAVGGGVWAWMYYRWQSLYAVWLSHLLVDLAIMAVGFDMVSRFW